LTGYGIAFGDGFGLTGNAGIGNTYFATLAVNDSPTVSFHHWYFQYCFAGAAAAIVSGAIAERVKEGCYLLFAFLLIAWVYPVTAHWIWSGPGFLSSFRPVDDLWLANGVLDFAGSCVIHLFGGVASFWAALISGPRYKRWDKHYIEKQVFAPQSTSWMAQGTFILWLGWFGFNCGSTIVIVGYTETAGLVAVNTILSAGVASIAGAALMRLVTGTWDVIIGLNCSLSGLVIITGSCAFVEPWCAVLFGVISALIYIGGGKLLIFLKVDDVVEATVVHGFCGAACIFMIGLFATDHNMRLVYGRDQYYGAFMGGGGEQLAMQCIGICVVVLWVSFWTILYWGSMRMLGWIRLSKTREKQMFQERLDQLARGKINLQSELPKDMQFHIEKHANSDGDRVAVSDMSESQ
jgi:Amt family ammonium transporter